MILGPLNFQPIDLFKSSDLCVRFREDSFVASFGDATKFYEEDGKGAERYLEWLQNKLTKDPASAVHVWKESTVIGQMELGVFSRAPDIGNVNLFYLVPDMRGTGYSHYLDEYAVQYFKSLGLKKCRLSVSPTNTRAIRFYEKNGWFNLGPRQDHPEVNFMEKSLLSLSK